MNKIGKPNLEIFSETLLSEAKKVEKKEAKKEKEAKTKI